MTRRADMASLAASPTRTMLRPREAACVLGVSERTVTNMLRRGELRNVATQRCRRVDREKLANRVSGNPAALLLLEGLLPTCGVAKSSQIRGDSATLR